MEIRGGERPVKLAELRHHIGVELLVTRKSDGNRLIALLNGSMSRGQRGPKVGALTRGPGAKKFLRTPLGLSFELYDFRLATPEDDERNTGSAYTLNTGILDGNGIHFNIEQPRSTT